MKVVSATGAIAALCFAQSVTAVPHHGRAFPSSSETPSVTPSSSTPGFPSWTPSWTPSSTPSTPSWTPSFPPWTPSSTHSETHPPTPEPTSSGPSSSFPWPTPTVRPTGTGGLPGPTGTGGMPWPTASGTGSSGSWPQPIVCGAAGGPPYGPGCETPADVARTPVGPKFRRNHARQFKPFHA